MQDNDVVKARALIASMFSVARWVVTVRGIAEQGLIVEAESANEARQKARGGDWDDVSGYPDWIRDGDDGPWRLAPAQRMEGD